MSKKLLILIFVLLLVLPFASAYNVILSPVEEDSHKIYFDETAKYTLSINNSEPYKVIYTLNVNPSEWVIESLSSFAVEANTVKKFPFNIKSRISNYKSPGTYHVPVTIQLSNKKVLEKDLVIYIKSFKEGYGEYIPAVSIDALVPSEIDLRNKLNIQLNLRNRNILEIEGMELEIDGDFFYKKDYINLSALAQKTIQYNFEVNEPVAPGDYNVRIRAKYVNKSLVDLQKTLEVVPYSVIDRSKTETSHLFRKTIVSKLTNNGNIPKKVITTLDSSWYVRIFSSVDVEADVVEKSGGEWAITLEPGESANFIVYENYRFPLTILLLLVLGTLGYFLYRPAIVLQKQIVITGKDAEGISEMKVRLFAKNRTSKSYFNLRIIDKAPSIATVIKSDSVGVLEPTKIIPTDKKGTIIKWDVDSLEAYEERIFTYTLKAKLKIIGNLSLPSVKAKFEDIKGDERTVQSSKAIIGAKTH